MSSNLTSLLSHFTNVEKVGEGLTSTVHKALDRDGNQVCLKVIQTQFYSKPLGKSLIDNEIKLLKTLKHSNILQFKQHLQQGSENILVTDFCESGNLYEYSNKKKVCSEEESVNIIRQILRGCQYLFQNGIIHRDLKPENIFLKNNTFIIADFGFAIDLKNDHLKKINAGSPLYMSPEALKSQEFSFESDIFSIGVMWYELLKGTTPWRASSEKQLINKISKQRPSITLSSKNLEKIILSCLDPDPHKRPKVDALLKLIEAPDAAKIKMINNAARKQNQCQKDKENNLKISPGEFKVTNNDQKTDRTGNKDKNELRLVFEDQTNLNTLDKQATKRPRKKGPELINSCPQLETTINRLNPKSMNFLPASMISKFELIIECYRCILSARKISEVVTVPQELKHDSLVLQMIKCAGQKQFACKVEGYIGRMLRLAKNYKVGSETLKDISFLCNRVDSLARKA